MENKGIKQWRVGLFDDHPVILDAVRNALKETKDVLEVAFFTSSRDELIREVNEQSPDLLVLDIISSEVTALELFEYFGKNHPEIAVIAYSSLSSPVLVENLLYLGVKGFVNKRQPLSDLQQAILLVAEEKISVPEDYKYLTSQFKNSNTALLTSREASIVRLIAEEQTSDGIARELGISVNTVENHRKRIFIKLNVRNVAGMVLEAARLGYLQ